MSGKPSFLRIENLRKSYRAGKVAVDNLSLEIFKGECLALIGESGSGKSTFGKCLLRLVEPDEGRMWHAGRDFLQMSRKQFRPYRRRFQMIFQNPLQALHPHLSVGSAIAEPLQVIHHLDKQAARDRVDQLLALVRLDAGLRHRFPHELSGGQRQRVALARALSTEPAFLVADEPTSSLDAALKRQIIGLFREMQQRFGLTLLLISHDLSVVYEIASRIAVIYRGKLVELGPARNLVQAPVHPYTKVLVQSALNTISSAPLSSRFLRSGTETEKEEAPGCPYAGDCIFAEAVCREKRPALKKISDRQFAACHLAGEVFPASKVDSIVTGG